MSQMLKFIFFWVKCCTGETFAYLWDMQNETNTTAMNFISAELADAIMVNIIKGMDIETATAQAYIDLKDALSVAEEEARQAKNNGTGTVEDFNAACDRRHNHLMEMVEKYGMDNYKAAHSSNKSDRARALITGEGTIRVRTMLFNRYQA